MSKEKCKICSSFINSIFKSKVLGKYDVVYYQCPTCGFIQTDEPHWLDEAYDSAITNLDLGLISRNLNYSEKIANIIINNFDINTKFLDYAGGYGMFTRLMRDKGFDYYHQDKFCVNLYAQNFELNDLPKKTKFELVTAFEVFEHFANPMKEIKKIFKYSDKIIFSTELQPDLKIKSVDDWWYFTPETGQHIAFYSKKALEFLAKFFNCYLYSEGSLHVLSKIKLNKKKLFLPNIKNLNLESLLEEDFQLAKKINKATDLNGLNNKSSKSYEKVAAVFEVKLLDALSKLEDKNKILISKNQEIDDFSKLRKNLELCLLQNQNEVKRLNSNLNTIQSTRLWQLSEKIRRIVKFLLPKNSSQRTILKKLHYFFLYAFQYLPSLFKVKVRNFIRYFHPSTNRKSKKIVYIGHSYHAKTKSTVFLIDYLKEYFDVTTILDETWKGKTPPNLDFIDDSYLGVVFFQSIYSPEVIDKIKNKNIIFCPMYDTHKDLDDGGWNQYKELKIISFSKTLYAKLTSWGFDCMYIQYFPKPLSFIENKFHKVFFWQRINKININVVQQLIGKLKTKVHIHKSIDPENIFISPSISQENKYHISYSKWFKTIAEMHRKIQECDIYVAPREYEGIGLSFLEAMSMGKAVIAVNNPTMNEYISHNKTGYLYELQKVESINFSNIQDIQRNCYKYMNEGYKKWKREKSKIIDFIKK